MRWTIDNGVCASVSDDVTITIIDIPTVSNAGPDQTVCINSIISLAANTLVFGTGLWTFVSGPAIPAINNNTVTNTTVTFPSAGTYIFKWTISNGMCAPSEDSVQITIVDLVSPPNAGVDQTLCGDTMVMLTGSQANNNLGTWTVIAGPNTPAYARSR